MEITNLQDYETNRILLRKEKAISKYLEAYGRDTEPVNVLYDCLSDLMAANALLNEISEIIAQCENKLKAIEYIEAAIMIFPGGDTAKGIYEKNSAFYMVCNLLKELHASVIRE